MAMRPLKLAWWPMWMEKLVWEVFFFLIHHLDQCQTLEHIKAASNVVIAFKWLKNLILWNWHVLKGMGDEDGCVDTQLFSLSGVFGTKWWQLVTGQCHLIHTRASGFPLLLPYLPYRLSGKWSMDDLLFSLTAWNVRFDY